MLSPDTVPAGGSDERPAPLASVVVPAHDEERSIGRLLQALAADVDDGTLELVVVCNGCTDGTAGLARQMVPTASVVEIDVASKHAALVRGDREARAFPRVYVDADVVVGGADVRALVAPLLAGHALVSAPARELDTADASWLVRSYYRVWERLGTVCSGLYGRGVLAVSEVGYQRLADRPEVMGDDLFVDLSFGPDERVVVGAARSRIRVPRHPADLLRRRVRAIEGNRALYRGRTQGRATQRQSLRDVLAVVRADRGRARDVPAFVAVTVVARLWARWRRWRTPEPGWLRDESSRQ